MEIIYVYIYDFKETVLYIQKYWVFGLCPLSSIVKSREHVSETGSDSGLR
jgi:hypothetical protein